MNAETIRARDLRPGHVLMVAGLSMEVTSVDLVYSDGSDGIVWHEAVVGLAGGTLTFFSDDPIEVMS